MRKAALNPSGSDNAAIIGGGGDPPNQSQSSPQSTGPVVPQRVSSLAESSSTAQRRTATLPGQSDPTRVAEGLPRRSSESTASTATAHSGNSGGAASLFGPAEVALFADPEGLVAQALPQVLAVTRRSSAQRLLERGFRSDAEFFQACRTLAPALGLPTDNLNHWDVMVRLLETVPALTPNEDLQADEQMTAVTILRALLARTRTPHPAALNRIAKTAAQILTSPRPQPDGSRPPPVSAQTHGHSFGSELVDAAKREGSRVATSPEPALALVFGVAHWVPNAVARTWKQDKTPNKVINLICEALDKLPAHGVDDVAAAGITHVLQMPVAGKGKHLHKLYENFASKATPEQLAATNEAMRAAGRM